MTVLTGFGYYTKDGVITDKYVLDPGEYPLASGYVQVEVTDSDALTAITVPIPTQP